MFFSFPVRAGESFVSVFSLHTFYDNEHFMAIVCATSECNLAKWNSFESFRATGYKMQICFSHTRNIYVEGNFNVGYSH